MLGSDNNDRPCDYKQRRDRSENMRKVKHYEKLRGSMMSIKNWSRVLPSAAHILKKKKME